MSQKNYKGKVDRSIVEWFFDATNNPPAIPAWELNAKSANDIIKNFHAVNESLDIPDIHLENEYINDMEDMLWVCFENIQKAQNKLSEKSYDEKQSYYYKLKEARIQVLTSQYNYYKLELESKIQWISEINEIEFQELAERISDLEYESQELSID
jgi:hypothetical protein